MGGQQRVPNIPPRRVAGLARRAMSTSVPPWAAWRTNVERPLQHVAVVGGTHGNEITGLLVAKHLMRDPAPVQRQSFKTSVIFSNVASVEANRRYVETDMNRCFLLSDLENKDLDSIEHRRAREVDAILGPKSSPSPNADIVFDLHNTTANTGFLLLMAPNDDFAHMVAAYLIARDPEVRVCEWSDKEDWSLLPTTGRSGMTVEV